MSVAVYPRLNQLLRAKNLTVAELERQIKQRFGVAVDPKTLTHTQFGVLPQHGGWWANREASGRLAVAETDPTGGFDGIVRTAAPAGQGGLPLSASDPGGELDVAGGRAAHAPQLVSDHARQDVPAARHPAHRRPAA